MQIPRGLLPQVTAYGNLSRSTRWVSNKLPNPQPNILTRLVSATMREPPFLAYFFLRSSSRFAFLSASLSARSVFRRACRTWVKNV